MTVFDIDAIFKRLSHPFYLIQLLYPLVFFVIRYTPSLANAILLSDDHPADNLKDLKIYAVTLGVQVFKLFTSATAEEFISVVGLYGKVLNLFMFYSYGKPWWVVGYGLGWAVLFAVIQQPPYRGPTKIVPLTAAELRTRVMRTPPTEPKIVEVDDQGEVVSAKGEAVSAEGEAVSAKGLAEGTVKHYIVLVWAPWSIACLNFEGVMADLSLNYPIKDLVFAKFNIDEDPTVAKDLMISDSALSPADLPTVILFTEGKEVQRLPELVLKSDEDKITGFGDKVSQGKVRNTGKDIIKRLAWDRSKASVIKAFKLDELSLEAKRT